MDSGRLEIVQSIIAMMKEFDISKIELDKNGNLVYISVLNDEDFTYRLDEIGEAPDVVFTELEEFLSDYDDPDLWPDGKKPVFEVL